MKNLFKYALIALITFSFSMPNLASANEVAAINQHVDSSINSMMESTMFVDENQVRISEEDKEELNATAKKLILSGEVKTNVVKDIDFYETTVQGVNYGDQVEYSVSYNSVQMNEDDVLKSVKFLNLVFNEDKQLKSVFELGGTVSADYIVTSEFWIDGELFNSVEQDISEEVYIYENASTEEVLNSFNQERQSQGLSKVGPNASEDQIFSAANKTIGERWDCTQSCVASKGVSMLAFAAIVAACGFACTAGVPATAGTACYACVNSAGILGATTILNCFDDCR